MKEYSRKKNSTINLFTGLLGQVLHILLKFSCRTVFIQTLGISYIGINGLFSDILSMLSLAELGLDTAISYRLYKPVLGKENDKVQAYIIFLRDAYRIIGICIFILGLLLIPFLHFFIADYDTLQSFGVSAGLLFVLFLIQNVSTYLFFAYKSIALKVNQKQYVLDIVGIFVVFFSTIVQIAVLLLYKNYIAYIVTITLFCIIQNLISARCATKSFPQYFNGRNNYLSKAERLSVFKDCMALFFYKINNVVMKATDNIVLSMFIGLVAVGLYSNYTMIFASSCAILNVFFRAVKASMGNLFVTNNIEKRYFFFEVMNYLTLITYGTAAICVAIVSNEFIECWIGPTYVLPQPIPMLIGIELLFTGLKLNLAQIRHVSGIFRQMWFRPVLGSAINIIFSIALVKVWGIPGVIAGTLLAAVFANFVVDPVAIHKYSFNGLIPSWHYYKKNLIFILVLIIIYLSDIMFCRLFFSGYGIWSLMAHVIICVLSVPFIFYFLFKRKRECQYFNEYVIAILRFKLASVGTISKRGNE